METIDHIALSNQTNNFTTRQTWLLNNRVPLLLKGLKEREGLNLNAKQVFETILLADPSANSSAAQWIVESYLREGFLWEDIKGEQTSKISETLKLFGKYKKHLPVEQRNIYEYATLADLYTSIQQYHLQEVEQQENSKQLGLKGQKLKRLEKQQAFANTHILSDDENLKVIIPLTKESAQWWGKGTRWCTSANEHNMFDDYNRDAPLIILLFKDNDKKERRLQLWLSQSNGLQFMDERDAPVDAKLIKDNWNILSQVILWSLEQNIDVFKIIPVEFYNQTICEQAVKISSNNLSIVPEQFKTQEICLMAVHDNGHMLEHVPEKFINYQMCFKAVETGTISLYYIPEKFQDRELYLKTVSLNRFGLDYVPKNKRDYDICLTSIEKFPSTIRDVPDNIYTEQMGLNLIRSSKQNVFNFLNLNRQTLEICLIACEKNGKALKRVLDEYKTREVCLAAVQNDGYSLENVPISLRDLEMCKIAVNNSPTAICDVPMEILYEGSLECVRMCEQAVIKLPNLISELPANILTFEFCSNLLKEDGNILYALKKRIILFSKPNVFDLNPQLYQMAFDQKNTAVKYIPENFRTPQMLKAIEEISNQELFKKQKAIESSANLKYDNHEKNNIPLWKIETITLSFQNFRKEIRKDQLQSNSLKTNSSFSFL